jgi:lactoylglutathione lyase
MTVAMLDYVVLLVRDIDRSIGFYTEVLGIRLRHRADAYAQLETGGTRLGLYTRAAMERTLGTTLEEPSPAAPAFEIGFKVPDVDRAFAEITARGAPAAAAPADRPWGQRTAYVRDPDGNLVELAQDVGAVGGNR